MSPTQDPQFCSLSSHKGGLNSVFAHEGTIEGSVSNDYDDKVGIWEERRLRNVA